MTWVRIDDGFAEHPKIHNLSDRAFRLHVTALCYCGRNLTDGLIAVPALKMLLAGCGATRKHVQELVASGVWDSGDNLHIHDFNDLNPTAAEVREKREKRKAAGRLGGLAKATANAKANATADASAACLPRPDPSQIKALGLSLVREMP